MSDKNPEQITAQAVSHRKNGKGVSAPVFIVSLALMGVVGYIVGTRSDYILSYLQGVKTSTDTLDLSTVQQAYQKLKANYDGTLDTNALIDGASRGMVAAAGNRYTVFMDKKEAADFDKELSGQVTGIGAEIGVRSSQPTIVRVLPDSPAEKSGLKANDTIVAVNGDSLASLTTEQVAAKIRGDAGSSVKVTIKRGETNQDFTITRAKVNNPSVRWEVRDGVGVITMTRFDTDTFDLAHAAAVQLKGQGVKAVILDLRDNGGGYLDAARKVSGLWLVNKTIVTEKRGDTVTGTEVSGSDATLAGVKTIVLVNGGSASASEIVSGALQDYNVATLLGEKTFGKGSVQQIIDLSDGRVLKVTVAKWYTPNGKNIDGQGITPSQVVAMTAADINAGKDPQMEAALAAAKQ